jgi:murein DD-endopeptidase MepM/ murein hydrolase activator NlpD
MPAAFKAVTFALLMIATLAMTPDAPPDSLQAAAAGSIDVFQFPLPTWEKHCLGFGSQWRYCDGTALRSCSTTGAVWLHTGFDVTTGIQPVRAAGDGVIIGYLIDPQFRGGVLIRHRLSTGTVITQYWHVWLRAGFKVGTAVKRGQVFADIADMGSRTHFHFAVFNGDFDNNAWRGALPPKSCDGFPAFPNKFIDPTAFVRVHQPAAAVVSGGASGWSLQRVASEGEAMKKALAPVLAWLAGLI